MNTVGQKWTLHRTYKRLQKLWTDYKNSVGEKDVSAIQIKLLAFLDYFQQSFEEWKDSGLFAHSGISVDKVYGDMSDVLVSLLDILDQKSHDKPTSSPDSVTLLAQIIHKVLSVAEMILQDEKYRNLVSKTPKLIQQVLEIFDGLKDQETKRLALKIVAKLSENTQNKREIGKREGYKKILDLLLDADANFTTEIAKTIRQILEDEDISENKSSNGQSEAGTSSRFGNIASMFGEMKDMMVSEVGKAFPNIAESIRSSNSELVKDNIYSNSFLFIPSSEKIEKCLENISKYDEEINDVLAAQPDDVREYFLHQGALDSLISSLSSCDLTYDARMEVWLAISALLYKNKRFQIEFRLLNGYQLLFEHVEYLGETNTSEHRALIDTTFDMIYYMALDGNKEFLLENMDAVDLLFKIFITSNSSSVRIYSIYCLQDLCSVNSLNATMFLRKNCIDYLMETIFNSLKPNDGAFIDGFESYFKSLFNLLNYVSVLLSKHSNTILLKYSIILSRHDFMSTNASSIVLKNLTRSTIILLQDLLAKSRLLAISSSSNDLIPNEDLFILMKNVLKSLQKLYSYSPSKAVKSLYDDASNEIYVGCLQALYLLISIGDANFDVFEKCDGWSVIRNAIMDFQSFLEFPIVYEANPFIPMKVGLHFYKSILRQKFRLVSDGVQSNCPASEALESFLIAIDYRFIKSSRLKDMFLTSQNSISPDISEDSGVVTREKKLIPNFISSYTSTQIKLFAMEELLSLLCSESKTESNLGAFIQNSLIKVCSIDGIFEIIETDYGFELPCDNVSSYLEQDCQKKFKLAVFEMLGKLISSSKLLKDEFLQCHGISTFFEFCEDQGMLTEKSVWKILLELSSTCSTKSIWQILTETRIYALGDVDPQKAKIVSPIRPEILNIGNVTTKFIHDVTDSHLLFTNTLPLSRPRHNNHLRRKPSGTKEEIGIKEIPGKSIEELADVETKSSEYSKHHNGLSRLSIRSIKISSRHGSRSGSFDNNQGKERSKRNSRVLRKSSTSDKIAPNSNDVNSGSIFSIQPTQISNEDSLITLSSAKLPIKVDVDYFSFRNLEISDIAEFSLTEPSCPKYLLRLLQEMDPDAFYSDREFFALICLLIDANSFNANALCKENVVIKAISMLTNKILSFAHEGSVDWGTISCHKEFLISSSKFDLSCDCLELIFRLAYKPQETVLSLEHLRDRVPVSAIDEFFNHASLGQQMQLHFLELLEKISERKDPDNFYFFDGHGCLKLNSLPKFPSAKVGYTISFNLLLFAIKGDECGLFAFSDNSTTFEGVFKRLAIEAKNANKKEHMDVSKYCLTIRFRHVDFPAEEIVFDKFDFNFSYPQWTSIAISQRKQNVSLFVNDTFVQSCSSFNYPIMENVVEPNINLVLGKIEDQVSVDEDKARDNDHNSARTPSVTPSKNWFGSFWSSSHLHDRASTSISTYKKIDDKCIKRTNMNGKFSSFTIFEGYTDKMGVVSKEKTLYSLPMEDMECPSGCFLLKSRSIHQSLPELGGYFLSCLFIEMGLAEQYLGLKLLGNFLDFGPQCYTSFQAENGWNVLYHILSHSQLELNDLTCDIFEILFDFACRNNQKAIRVFLQDTGAFTLILDLILECRENVQQMVLRKISDILITCPENISYWKTNFGLEICFEILQYLPSRSHSCVFSIIDALFNDISAEELQRILYMISFEKREVDGLKIQLMEMIYQHASYDFNFLNLLKINENLMFFLALLELNHGRLSLLSLRVMALIMESLPKSSYLGLLKIGFFEVLSLNMGSLHLTLDHFEALLFMSSFSLKCSPENHPRAKKGAKSGDIDETKAFEKHSIVLHSPEAFKTIFDLLKLCSDESIVIFVLGEIKRRLSLENMRILWECPWLDWAASLETHFAQIQRKTSKSYSAFRAIIQKMIIYDIQRKSSVCTKLKGNYTDDDNLQTLVAEVISEYFDLNPCIAFALAPEILKNLVLFYRNLDEHLTGSPRILQTFILFVGHLVAHNNAQIRSAIKNAGMLDFRDELVIRLLHSHLDHADLKQFLSTFAFDHVADQPKFRDSNGLLILLRIFHQSNQQIQLLVGKILLEIFCVIDENRKIVSKVIEDVEVLRKLYANIIPYDEIFHDMSPSSARDQRDPSDCNYQVSSFISWYFSPAPEITLKRTIIEQRIETLYFPLASAYQKTQEKILSKRNRRNLLAKDQNLKVIERLNKMLIDIKAKSVAKLAKFASLHQNLQDDLRKARHERRRIGEETWKEKKVQLLITK